MVLSRRYVPQSCTTRFFIVQEVVLDQKKIRGQVAIRILWQTGATSEHQIQRRVQSYDRDYGELELVRERITELNAAGDMDCGAAINVRARIASPWNAPDRHCPLPHHNVPHDWDPDHFFIGSIAGSNCIAPNTIAWAFSFR